MQKNRLIIAVVAAFVLLSAAGIVIWELGTFHTGLTTTSTGFDEIKPQLTSISFREDGTFTGTFVNIRGAVITVDQEGVLVADASGRQCATVIIEPASLRPGDGFRLTASGCGARSQGDTYTLAFSIPYNASIGITTRGFTESGNIRGPVE